MFCLHTDLAQAWASFGEAKSVVSIVQPPATIMLWHTCSEQNGHLITFVLLQAKLKCLSLTLLGCLFLSLP